MPANNLFEEKLKSYQEKNRKFSEETEAFLLDASTMQADLLEIDSLEAGIKKINTLTPDHPICLRIQELKELLDDHKDSNESFGRIPNTFSSNAIRKFILGDPNYLKLFPATANTLVDFSEFLANLNHLCKEPERLKNDQKTLSEVISRLLPEMTALPKKQGGKYNELFLKFNKLYEKYRENKRFFKNFKNYREIFKETYTLVKESTTLSNELADKVEQTLKALVNSKQYDNKAVKLSFWRPTAVPDGIEKMRTILSDSSLSHERKLVNLANIVKLKTQRPQRLRKSIVNELYQQLNSMFQQYYPELYRVDNKEQGNLPSDIFYDTQSSSEKIDAINKIAQSQCLQLTSPKLGYAVI
jgi:DNA repair ATPase RecN